MNWKNFVPCICVILLAAVFCTSPAGADNFNIDLESTEITLPWSTFENIVEQIKKLESMAPDSGRKYIVNSVAYEVITQREQIRIEAVYNITVLSGGWTQVPLERGGRTLAEFSSSAGDDTIFYSSNNGSYSLLCASKGDRTLKLTMYAPGNFNKYENSFRLYLSPEAVSRKIKLVVPEEGVDAKISSAAHSETFSGNGRTVVVAAPGNDDSIYLKWERTPEAQKGVANVPVSETEVLKPEPRILADLSTDIFVADNSVSSYSRIEYKIMNTTVKEFMIELPAAAVVEDVTGPPIRAWKEIKGEATKTLQVILVQEAEGNVGLNVICKIDVEGDRTELPPPVPRALGVDREKGVINIGADDNIEINVLDYTKAAPVDLTETNYSLSHFLSFKYLETPFTLVLELKRNQRLAAVTSVVDLAAYTSVKLEDGKFLTMCSFYMRNNNLPFLKIDLPQEAEVWSALVNDSPAKPSRNSEGLLLVPLPLNAGNEMNVEVLYLQNEEEMHFRGALAMEAPMPEAPVTMLMWEVYTPADYDYYGIKSELEQYAGRPFINQGVVSMEGAVSKRYSSGPLPGKPVANKVKSSSSSVKRQNITRLGDYVDQQVLVQNMAQPEIVRSYEVSEGVLPIKINLPTEGNYYYFQKVMPGEGDTKVEMKYLGGKYLRVLKKTGRVIALIAAIALALLAWRSKPEDRPLAKILFVLFAAGMLLNPGHQGFLVVIAVLALLVAIVFLARRKHGTAAAVIVAAIVSLAASGAHAQGTVTMDWNDYSSLTERLENALNTEPLQPFVISDADYKIKASGASLLAETVFKITSFADESHEVPLFNFGEQVVTGFTSTVSGDRLLRRDDGYYAILVTSRGRRTIRLTFAAGVSMERLEGSWSFGVPSATANSVSFFVPDRKVEITLSSAANVFTDYSGAGTAYAASFPPTQRVSFSWKRKADDIRPEEMPEPRTDATVSTLISVSEGIVSYTSRVRYEVNHAGLDSYSIALPQGVDIIDVSGNQVRDISIGMRDGEQIVRVLLSEKMMGTDSLTLKYEKVFSPGEPFETAIPRPLDVTSLSGSIGVTGKQEIEILPVREVESLQVDPTEISSTLNTSAPILFAYKYFEQPAPMQFMATVNESVAVVTSVVNSAEYTTVIMPDGRRLNSYRFDLETRDRQFFNVFMPGGCNVWSVTVNGSPVIASEGEDNRVLVPVRNVISPGSASTLTVETVALCETGKSLAGGSNEVEFPHIEMPISKLEATVYVPREWEVKKTGGNLGEGTVGGVELLSYYIPSLDTASPYVGVKDGYYDQSTASDETMKKMKQKKKADIGIPPKSSNINKYKGAADGNELSERDYIGVPEPAPLMQSTSPVMRRGSLPVQIYLPRTGRKISFARSMVIGEMPKVEFTLRKEMATRTIKYAGIAFIVLILALVIVFTPLNRLFANSVTGPVIAVALPLLVLGAHHGPAFTYLLQVVLFIAVAIFVVRWGYEKIRDRKRA